MARAPRVLQHWFADAVGSPSLSPANSVSVDIRIPSVQTSRLMIVGGSRIAVGDHMSRIDISGQTPWISGLVLSGSALTRAIFAEYRNLDPGPYTIVMDGPGALVGPDSAWICAILLNEAGGDGSKQETFATNLSPAALNGHADLVAATPVTSHLVLSQWKIGDAATAGNLSFTGLDEDLVLSRASLSTGGSLVVYAGVGTGVPPGVVNNAQDATYYVTIGGIWPFEADPRFPVIGE